MSGYLYLPDARYHAPCHAPERHTWVGAGWRCLPYRLAAGRTLADMQTSGLSV